MNGRFALVVFAQIDFNGIVTGDIMYDKLGFWTLETSGYVSYLINL